MRSWARRSARRGLVVAALCGACVFADRAEAESLVRFEAQGEATAVFFLLETHLDTAATIDDMRLWYAEKVRYYGRGAQDRALVLTDKKYYLDRWPRRLVTPDLSTLTVASLSGGVYEVAIEVDFTVSNDRTTISGRTRIELTLEEGPDGLKITREGGRILSRRDGAVEAAGQ